MKHYTVTYAQNREDVLLDGFFKDVKEGFYVDIGANHPIHDSVTKLFYDRGWRGINVEPNQQLFNLLCVERPHDINLNMGISDKRGELTFREYEGFLGSGLSTFSDEMKESYMKTESDMSPYTKSFKDRKVTVITLAKLFAEHETSQINFLKIDVEGHEYEVLAGNDWEKYRPQMICIEANHVNRDWRPILKKAKYDMVFFDGLNEYYLANEHPEIADNFSYRQSVIGRPLISLDISQELFKQESINKKLEADRLRLRRNVSELEKQTYHLSQIIEGQQGVKQQVKMLLRSVDQAFIRRITKLDVTKKRSITRSINIPDLSNPDASKSELLKVAQLSDLENFYITRKRNIPSPRHLFFVLTLQTYMAFRNAAKYIMKFLAKLMRKVKGSRHV